MATRAAENASGATELRSEIFSRLQALLVLFGFRVYPPQNNMSFLIPLSKLAKNRRFMATASRAILSRSMTLPMPSGTLCSFVLIVIVSVRSFSQNVRPSTMTPRDDGDFVFAQTAYKFDVSSLSDPEF